MQANRVLSRGTEGDSAVDPAVSRLCARIWAGDASVWPGATRALVAQRLGWLKASDRIMHHLPKFERLAAEFRAEGMKDVVLLGMGGSVRGADALTQAFGSGEGGLRLHVLDSTVPSAVLACVESLDPRRTCVVEVSKSGRTLETEAMGRYFEGWLRDHGVRDWQRRFICVSDPGTPLTRCAEAQGFRAVISGEEDYGGRFSVLSSYGLLPAVLAGIDARSLLTSAARMRSASRPDVLPDRGTPLRLGLTLGQLALDGRDKAALVTSPRLRSFGRWLQQLLAESTGKEGRGLLPLVNEPQIAPGDYPSNHFFVALQLAGDEPAAPASWLRALEEAGHPVLRFTIARPTDLGGEFFRWEFACVVAAAVLGVNPLDEPDVTAAKVRTEQLLQRYAESGRLPDPEPGMPPGLLIRAAQRDGYLAVQAFLTPSPPLEEQISLFRRALLERYGVTTTFDYGPRYLHATGQYHKGGPPGRFLQLWSSAEPALPIPGRPYNFRILAQAQMLADAQLLRDLGRVVSTVDVAADPEWGLAPLWLALTPLATAASDR